MRPSPPEQRDISNAPALGAVNHLNWDEVTLRYEGLESVDPTADNLPSWLEEWSDLRKIVWERWSVVKSAEGRDLGNETAQDALGHSWRVS
ncbi:MAG TPA: hypothetical protein VFB58_11985 [Chloroflexota bacterium]|nr:hypothetical protein [Chloroflexota bacterium]